MRLGFVIPVYNHGNALENVVKQLEKFNLPIIVVDDGNDEENRNKIEQIAYNYSLVKLVTRKKNGGKGRAMKDGVIFAEQIGLTHIFQIDSDGQHDISRVEHFIELSEQNPKSVICGYPLYSEDAPNHRKNGRKIANGWIHFVTLSKKIVDGMIGFRIYPVESYMNEIRRHSIIDNRMGYDIDILVHLFWRGIDIISAGVKISYPSDGISNFHMIWDNARIALVYSRLCICLLFRLPKLIFQKNHHSK